MDLICRCTRTFSKPLPGLAALPSVRPSNDPGDEVAEWIKSGRPDETATKVAMSPGGVPHRLTGTVLSRTSASTGTGRSGNDEVRWRGSGFVVSEERVET